VSEERQTLSEGVDESANSAQEEARRHVSRRAHFLASAKALLVTIVVALLLKTFVVEAFRIPSGSMENTLLVGDFLLVNKLAYGLKTPHYIPMTTKAIPTIAIPVFGGVRRGDVLVFEYPGRRTDINGDGPVYFIKRCVGLPGDTIAIRSGKVTINGLEVVLPTHAKLPEGARIRSDADYSPTVVPRKGERISLTAESVEGWKDFLEREHHRIEVSPEGRVLIDGIERHDYPVERNYFFVLGDNRGNSLDSRVWGFVPEDAIIGEALMVYWSRNSEPVAEGSKATTGAIRWNRIGMLIR
jgi:signal peptidase I